MKIECDHQHFQGIYSFKYFCIAIGVVIIVEWSTQFWNEILILSHLQTVLLLRTVEILALILILFFASTRENQSKNFTKERFRSGIELGLKHSFFLGASVFFLSLVFYLITSQNPLLYLIFKLPERNGELILFLITGGIISPIAEELFFRGVFYCYFRKFGKGAAFFVSTFTFALCHYNGNQLPILQIIGGSIFGFAYERSKGALNAPMIIHAIGNITIFSMNCFINL